MALRIALRQRGVGLIEIMIGLAAGLVLIGALAYFFLGSRQLNRTQDDVSRMQESGRIALEVMGRAIRQAGARANVNAAFPGNALLASDGAGGASDSITVRYDVQDGGEVDCVGNAVASGPVVYVFTVNPDDRTLRCANSPGGGTVVVIDNIANMQITYGLDAARDGVIDSYEPRSGAVPTAAAVRVSVLVRGGTENVAAGKAQTYKYDGANVPATDRYLRQVYTSTFAVRNQAF